MEMPPVELHCGNFPESLPKSHCVYSIQHERFVKGYIYNVPQYAYAIKLKEDRNFPALGWVTVVGSYVGVAYLVGACAHAHMQRSRFSLPRERVHSPLEYLR